MSSFPSLFLRFFLFSVALFPFATLSSTLPYLFLPFSLFIFLFHIPLIVFPLLVIYLSLIIFLLRFPIPVFIHFFLFYAHVFPFYDYYRFNINIKDVTDTFHRKNDKKWKRVDPHFYFSLSLVPLFLRVPFFLFQFYVLISLFIFSPVFIFLGPSSTYFLLHLSLFTFPIFLIYLPFPPSPYYISSFSYFTVIVLFSPRSPTLSLYIFYFIPMLSSFINTFLF